MWTLMRQCSWALALFAAGLSVAALIEFGLTGRRVARTYLFNVAYGVAITLLTVVLQPLADAEAAGIQRVVGLPPVSLPAHGWGACLSALILMVVADAIFYWVHRAQHRWPVLWAIHSFHHSDDDLNAATSYRHFWLEKPIWVLILYLPLGMVFRISPQVAVAYGAVFSFFAYFPHMGLRLDLGPLTRVILGPQLHRLHHSVESRHFDTNFCGAFPVWDILFGTYVAPQPGAFPATGLPDVTSRPSAAVTMLWPAYWQNGRC